jgi:hypothetical protein
MMLDRNGYPLNRKMTVKDGALIRKARRRGETVTALAAKYRVTPQAISNVGSGRLCTPDLKVRLDDDTVLRLFEVAEREGITVEEVASRILCSAL